MTCRNCAARAHVIKDAAKAALQGDTSKLAPAAQFVATTWAQDAKAEAARIRAMLRRN